VGSVCYVSHFLSWLDVHWTRQDQSRDWVGQEKESFFGVLEAVTSDRVFLHI
jgi:hypothetical protein